MLAQRLTKPIYILDALRTPIGSPFKSLKNLTAAQLAALVIKEIAERNSVDPSWISEVILGNTVAAGIGQNLARQAAFLAGLSGNIPAYTINSVCGSGLQAVILSVQSILAGASQLNIAGGAESATHCPYLVAREEELDVDKPQYHSKDFKDSLFWDGLFCSMTGKSMGQLVEAMAHKYKISRQDQDTYALESHHKAILARQEGLLTKEILPLRASEKKTIVFDDRPRPKLMMENLMNLSPAFDPQGTVTAGNASVPCDGAAAILIASPEAAEQYRLRPLARIIGYAVVMLTPERTFEADPPAIEACLKKCGLTVEDIDLLEIGEAFAAQCILTRKALNIPCGKMNSLGGDIALGHPLGAAGARVLTTLVHSLQNRQLKTGLACICYGGGGAIAVIIQRIVNG